MKIKFYILLLSFFMSGFLQAASEDGALVPAANDQIESPLPNLPNEVWMKIFSLLEERDLGRVRQVSRLFLRLGHDSAVVKTHGGFQLGGVSRLPSEIILTPDFLTAALQNPEIFGNFQFVSALINNLDRLDQASLLAVAANYDAIERTLLAKQERQLQTRLLKGDAEDPRHVAAIFSANQIVWNAAWIAAGNTAGNAAWDAARNAAWDVAWDAAWNAAWIAAWNAARNAAGNAAGDAAWIAAGIAAGNTARNAAWDAARDAARDAAGNAARNKLYLINPKLNLSVQERGQINYQLAALMALQWTLTPEAEAFFDTAYNTALPLIPADLTLEEVGGIIAAETWDKAELAGNPYIELLRNVFGPPAIEEVVEDLDQ